MSKMDRLFGVTMQEGGVSQLLSLRLEAAKALVEDQSISAHNSHSLISEAV
jgi:transcriptional regulator GlxA family with amidase domain